MKRIIMLLLLAAGSFSAMAQSKKVGSVTTGKWVLEKDEMKGLGTHHSIEKNTTLQFLENGNWISSHPIEGVSSGGWKKGDKGRIIMRFGEDKTAVVEDQTDCCITVVMKDGTRKLAWTWKREK